MTRYKERFHQAARDGYLDRLREATRSEADGADENGMSPVMWAAFYGNLDALRLLIQRGGNPDKTDHMGSTALHFAALNGHMHCVTFLVNFGANIWVLDNDLHTALDLAGLREHRDIVEYLDSVAGKQVSLNRRVVSKLREKAALEAQKRVKKFDRLLRKTSKKAAKEDAQQQLQQHGVVVGAATSNPNYRHTDDRQRRRSFSLCGSTIAGGVGGGGSGGSMTDLTASAPAGSVTTRQRLHSNGSAGPRPFSEYLTGSSRSGGTSGGTIGGVGGGARGRSAFGAARKVVTHKQQQLHYDDPQQLMLSASSHGSDVVYARTSADGRSILSGPTSEPDMQQQQLHHRRDDSGLGSSFHMATSSSRASAAAAAAAAAGLFERPGFGSVAFFHRHPNGNRGANPAELSPGAAGPSAHQTPSPTRTRLSATDSIGTSGSLMGRWRDLPWSAEDVDNLEDDFVDGDGGDNGTLVPRAQLDLELFLACLGLTECMPALVREQIDLDALSLCTDADLQGLGLPLGPRKKILEAVQRRREAFESRDCLRDLRL